MAVGATRSCLYIAIKYAMQRLAVGPKGESDTPIFAFQLQKNSLIPLLARSISLGLFHVKCKNVYQNPKGYEREVLSLCCMDKTLNGWNLERVSSICRERCGGQGYLSVNKFGDYMAIAHAAVTAEGDNRVLMVKVCKDMKTNIEKFGQQLPAMTMCPVRQIAKATDVTTLDILINLLKYREIMLYQQWMKQLKDLQSQGKSAYQILMRETSDVMQELALAYGERQTLQYCISCLSTLRNTTNKQILTQVFRLFASEIVIRDMTFYMLNGTINEQAHKKLIETRITLIN